ncbi:MAG: glutamate synthase large subunit [Thermodesulfobacteriota bacterium]
MKYTSDTHLTPFHPYSGGLYDPRFEHDACGVGMICHLKGERSHAIIQDALDILRNLSHRGACGCDEATGDGAGILMQMPHAFLVGAVEGFHLPNEKEYGAGAVFLPPDSEQADICADLLAGAVQEAGGVLLGWRRMPVDNQAIGDLARRAEPMIRHVFIGRRPGLKDEAAFERQLFLIRKTAEKTVRESNLPQKGYFHIPSLSCRTLVYKGMFLADQVAPYYPDLLHPEMTSALALVHQRYSTNTFPSWDLAQPFRFLCHNGEINTLRTNINWMNARQHRFKSDKFGEDLRKLLPVASPGASDSAILDNAVEVLYHTGRSLPHAIMMLIPEAWQNHATMSEEKRAFYEYHACLMEPWDGPAAVPFTDGTLVGAVLDRNGLRPSRYTVTTDDRVVMASETGVLQIPAEQVRSRGRLQPGRMLLIDLDRKRIVDDEEIKSEIAGRRPYGKWLADNRLILDRLPEPENGPATDFAMIPPRQQAFGYTREDLKILIGPMARDGKEPTGSMGDDIPLAVLSERPCLLYDYFKQLFAQVTNPPLDPIREELVTSLITFIGPEGNLFEETPEQCRMLRLENPILTPKDLSRIRRAGPNGLSFETLSLLFEADSAQGAGTALKEAMDRLCEAALKAVDRGREILILSDRGIGPDHMAIPALLATAGVHHHLIREGRRTRCGLIIETGEAREIHHFCCLLGFGAGAIVPYLAFETIEEMILRGELENPDPATARAHYMQAAGKGILKVMAKMGISTLQSYRGAQIFECLGLSAEVVDRYFTGTPTRLKGMDLDSIAEEVRLRHRKGFPEVKIPGEEGLDIGGRYQWRRGGESHQYGPRMVARFQQAVREENPEAWREYTDIVHRQNRAGGEIRGLLEFRCEDDPISLDEVEPWTEIVKRFKTGAMSYGSISKEAHEALAIAMNRIGGKSNSGEGGEDPDRFDPDPNGDWRNSAVKQIASGRFGVTGNYLAHAADLQIKVAQGAKPGEGGQLPGFKVYPWIARTRHSTPYVGLISPPPHHDIYSIEDLAQLIHDLKNANPTARISVKLVSEIGVGTVAAGVAKGRADTVLISGHSGGTGASPQSSIRYGGLPWELGLSETQQTLVLNGLRSRITVECDGQMKTGRDVAIACLLGAEEFGFGTLALVALGCIMMRVCHLNTCPVGIATQDPELRKKFTGKPEHVIAMMRFIAEDMREIMARLGFRTVAEMVGRSDKLEPIPLEGWWKAAGLDLSPILYRAEPPPALDPACYVTRQDHRLDQALDHSLIQRARPALETGEPVEIDLPIRNVNRTLGTLLSHEITRRYGEKGLPEDTVLIRAHGSGGQSFCAFGAPGLSIHVQGDANDYFGKGLSGARLSIRPPDGANYSPEDNIIIGNVAFYGAISGEAYISGLAGERFCVRNSGVCAVVEGIGDHGCEYMTGGKVVILGPTGRNFAAGMSGGIAYVLDSAGDFGRYRCNTEMVDLETVADPTEADELRRIIEAHVSYTRSPLAGRILENWTGFLPQFVKIMPVDYKKALERMAEEAIYHHG